MASFEPISTDNRRIVFQAWAGEALTMWGIAVLVIVVTAISGIRRPTAVGRDGEAAGPFRRGGGTP